MDFGVPGILRVRTHDARDADRAAVTRDIGPPRTMEGESPEVVVRFVDDLSHTPLHILDGGRMAYGRDGVYFLDSSSHRPLARVSQGERWGEASIICRRGVRRVPSLSSAVDLATLSRGWAPLHASAWVTPEGTCVVVAGWARSGKTGALLAACDRGSTPVGDDRVLLARDGSRVVGLGRPIVVKDWHLAQLRLPELGARPARRALAKAAPILDALPAGRVFDRLRGKLNVELNPHRLTDRSNARDGVRPDVLVVLESHRRRSIESEPIDSQTAANHIAAQVDGELVPALRAQASFRYALPGRGWKDVARATEVAESIVKEATRELPACLVRHPYPCSLKRLDEVIAAAVASAARAS